MSRSVDQRVGQVIGSYRLESSLGSGASGTVFRATSRSRAVCALKVLDGQAVNDSDPHELTERINRQRDLIGVHHPNLVRTLDAGYCTRHRVHYVAMELLEWRDLARSLQSVPRIRIAPLIEQVASAARFLESIFLAHRDIKPANIAAAPDFSTAKLLDLGVVRPVHNSDLTASGAMLATRRYCPPEYLLFRMKQTPEAWRALTFYQLGGVLHDLIMQKPLFSEARGDELVIAIERIVPRIEASDVDPRIIELANRCLDKDPENRLARVSWQDFSELERPQSTVASPSPIDELGARQLEPQLLPITIEVLLRSAYDSIESALRAAIRQAKERGWSPRIQRAPPTPQGEGIVRSVVLEETGAAIFSLVLRFSILESRSIQIEHSASVGDSWGADFTAVAVPDGLLDERAIALRLGELVSVLMEREWSSIQVAGTRTNDTAARPPDRKT